MSNGPKDGLFAAVVDATGKVTFKYTVSHVPTVTFAVKVNGIAYDLTYSGMYQTTPAIVVTPTSVGTTAIIASITTPTEKGATVTFYDTTGAPTSSGFSVMLVGTATS